MSQRLTEKEFSVLTIGTEILTKDGMDQYMRTLGPVKTYYASKLNLALETFSRERTQIIFCELNFADGSAQQFIEKIGGLHFDFTTYFVVADRSASSDLEALKGDWGIDEVLVKPFNAETIKEIFERAVTKLTGPKPTWAIELRVAIEAERTRRVVETERYFIRIASEYEGILEPELELFDYWYKTAKYNDCERLIEKLVEKYPTHCRILENKAKLLKRAGQHEKALEYFKMAQKISPLNASRGLEIADTYLLLAADTTRKVNAIDEYLSEAHLMYGKIQAVRRQYAAAITQSEIRNSYFTEEHLKEMNAFAQLSKSLGKLK